MIKRTNKSFLIAILVGMIFVPTTAATRPSIAKHIDVQALKNQVRNLQELPMIERVFCWNVTSLRIPEGGSVATAINLFRSTAKSINVAIEVDNEKEFVKRFRSPAVDFRNKPLGEAIYEYTQRMGAKCYFLQYYSKIYITHSDIIEVKTDVVDGVTWSYVMIGGDVFLGDGKNMAIDKNQLLALWKDNNGKVVIPSKIGGKNVVGINAGALCLAKSNIGDIKTFEIDEEVSRLDFEIPPTVKYIDDEAFSTENLGYMPVAVVHCQPPIGWRDMGGLKYCQVNQKDGWLAGMANEARFMDYRPWRRKKTINGIEWSYDVLDAAYLGTAPGTAIPTSTAGKLRVPMSMDGRPVVVIGEDAFRNCAKLTAIEIPTKVLHIRKGAFSGCNAVKEIVIAATELESIDSEVFADLPSLKKVTFLGKMPQNITGECDYFTLGRARNVKFEIKNRDSWRSAFFRRMTRAGWKGLPRGR